MRLRFVSGAVLLLALWLGGCATGDFDSYRRTIADFQAATAHTAAATRGYLLGLNDFERTVELNRLRYDAARPLDLNALQAEPFSPEAIQVRLQAFAVIDAYTQALAALAGDAPEAEWQAASRAVGDKAADLLATVQGLSGATLPDLSGPLQTLLGFGGSQYLNLKRSRALDAAIAQASPAVTQISQLLQEDLRAALRLRETGVGEHLGDAGLAYRRLQQTPPSDAQDLRRQYILHDIERTLAQREALAAEAEQVAAAMKQFDEAHAALVAYARSDRSERELAALVAEVREYAAAAASVYRTFAALGAAA